MRDLAAYTQIADIMIIAQHAQAIATDVQMIAASLASFNAHWARLTGVDALPATGAAWHAWKQEAAGLSLQCAQVAGKAQELLYTTVAMLNSLVVLINGIRSLIGNLQGVQTVSAVTSQLVAQVGQTQAMLAPYQQAMLSGVIIEQTHVLVYARMAQERMRDWGILQP
jgi:hypothetical protein